MTVSFGNFENKIGKCHKISKFVGIRKWNR